MTKHEELTAEIAALELENAALRAEVEALSTDAVTGIAGRRVLDRELEQRFQRSRRTCLPAGVIMVDIDHFKRVNDERGHQEGDRILHQVAQTIAGVARAEDTVARYGGEEIAVLTDARHGLATMVFLAERIREAIEAAGDVTASVGCSISYQTDEDGAAALGRADQALYAAKRAGRNRVEVRSAQ